MQYFVLFIIIYLTSDYFETMLFPNTKINPIDNVVYSFLILILYIFFNKFNYKFIIFIILSISIVYFIYNIYDYYNSI